ncbi:MAG: twin-arginine translocation signal domain-containing protein [Sedimentisphaerales bacterium]|nr:twin-arginine translocation signal domain-containing protein [Sedimentisphaerales bacterium]
MKSWLNRRRFIKKSLLASAGGALSLQTGSGKALAQGTSKMPMNLSTPTVELPKGKIGKLSVSRLLLGGNLLTHFTHSRDLKYVYNLTAHYNTEEKIHETMAIAEANGIDTLVIHTAPGIMSKLKKYRHQLGGKIKWIICPTATIDDSMTAYSEQVRQLAGEGTDAIYLWGVQGDALVSKGRVDLIEKAVEIAKDQGVPSGVGAHDLRVITECEKNKIDADFYIKTFHHHNYSTAPKSDELTEIIAEVPGYWCNNPQKVADFMKTVKKPWIAFKVMAAGAIPPKNAFRYAYENGADHILAGMFDFEIAEDAQIAKTAITNVKRSRPWRS